MPYITQQQRQQIDLYIDRLATELMELSPNCINLTGPTNYAITRLVNIVLRPDGGWSYSSLSRALAVFRDAETEMRRRLLDPYEDQAIQKNGDVLEYESPR